MVGPGPSNRFVSTSPPLQADILIDTSDAVTPSLAKRAGDEVGCCTLYMVERQRRNPGEEWGSCDRGMFAQEEWPVDNTWDSEISYKTTREEPWLIVLNVCRGFFFRELKRCSERFYPVHQGMVYMNCHCYMTLESPPKTVLRKFHTLILWDVTGYRKTPVELLLGVYAVFAMTMTIVSISFRSLARSLHLWVWWCWRALG